jgi:hypothetical protein
MSEFEDACGAVRRLIRERETVEPIPKRVEQRWWKASNQEILEMLSRRDIPRDDKRPLGFLYADRLAMDAEESGDPAKLRSSLARLVYALANASRADAQPKAARLAAALAAERLLVLGLRVTQPTRDGLERTIERFQRAHVSPNWVGGLGMAEAEFGGVVQTVRTGLMGEQRVHVPRPRRAQPRLSSVADTLVEAATHQRDQDQDLAPAPRYNRKDAERRLHSVALDGFRGSPGRLELDFLAKDKPVSALLFGDNGVGKSTIVDAVEFALQGRIARSVDFSSSLAPAVASLVNDRPTTASVELNDGTTISRRLIQSDAGRLIAQGDPIRPGFRLAPITLKRADILRFLDTESLSRGMIAFDYFPTSSDRMALRPEEELRQLDEEAYGLRVRRKALAQRVAERLDVAEEDAANAGHLQTIIKERILGGATHAVFEREGGWDAVDPDLRGLLAELQEVQRRLAKIKRDKERGVEILNPVAYKEQARIVRMMLEGAGEELTRAFRQITGAQYVQRIDVLFGLSGPVALDVVVQFPNGRNCFPQQVFSEGYRDLLALLLFMAVAQQAATRLWIEQLRVLLSRHNHPFVERHIYDWSFDAGPLVDVTIGGPDTSLRAALASHDTHAICSQAGRTLELAANHLSWRLPIPITRREGDKYELGDLWPPLAKALRSTDAAAAVEEIDQLVSLRNIFGAHYNYWAESLPLSDARTFGFAVLDLVERTYCRSCHDWITRRNGRSCPCGTLRLGRLSGGEEPR